MKSIYLIFLFSIISFFANAQISIGLRGGLNVANQIVEINRIPIQQSPKNIVVWDFALPVNVKLTYRFSIQPEVHFIQKGELAEFFNNQGDFTSIKCRYNYLDIPLLMKLDFDKGGGKIYAIGGPFFSYGLGGTEFITIGEQSEENDIDFEDKRGFGIIRKYDRVNFGAVVGLGMIFPVSRGNIVTDLRFAMAFDNVFNEEVLDDVLTARNYGIAITVGYMHNFGKTKKSKKKNIDDGYEILK